MARELRVLSHVRRRHEQMALRAPRRGVRQPQRGVALIDPHGLPRLVLEVVGHATDGDLGLVAAAERVIALRDHPVTRGLVARLLPQQL